MPFLLCLAAASPARADDSVDSPAARRTEVWDVLRSGQSQITSILHGMVQRLDAALSRDDVEGMDPEGLDLKLGIQLEEPVDGNIAIGFFKDARWWIAEPAFVRMVPGSGIHTLTGIPPGQYFLGAMIGRYPHPAAVGVCRSWPDPVLVKANQPARSRLFLSPRFEWHSGPIDGDEGKIHVSTEIDTSLVQAVDVDGNVLPYCDIDLSFDEGEWNTREADDVVDDEHAKRERLLHRMLHPQLSVMAVRHDVQPELMATRSLWVRQILRLPRDGALKITLPDFPSGDGVLEGAVQDQHGNAVQEFTVQFYRLPVEEQVGELIESGAPFSIEINMFHVSSTDGRFRCTDLAPGDYVCEIGPFDRDLYLPTSGDSSFTIEQEGKLSAQVQMEVERRRYYYGVLTDPDGRAVNNVVITRESANGVNKSSQLENPFRWAMSAADEQDLLEHAGGMLRIEDAENPGRYFVAHYRELAVDDEEPTVFTATQ